MAFVLSRWLLCLLMCGLAYALRQSMDQDVQDEQNVNLAEDAEEMESEMEGKMVCECKEVKSVDECPNYKIKKGGFPPSFPRYYHQEVESGTRYVNLCCRMASTSTEKGRWEKLKVWKSTYVAQKTKDKCLEETRPLKNACCTVKGSSRIYGPNKLRLSLSSAKVYSMAHQKMKPSGSPTWKDYKKKSRIFIETEGVSDTTGAGGESISANKLQGQLEGIKKFLNVDELQCEEDVAKVVEGKTCKALQEQLCCCSAKAMDLKDTECVTQSCAPQENPLPMAAAGYHRHKIKHSYGTDYQGVTAFWPEIFYHCPKEFTDAGAAFERAKDDEMGKRVCTKTGTWETGFLNHRNTARGETTACTRHLWHLKCPAGKVMYHVRSRGVLLKGGVNCPASSKTSLKSHPNFDFKCSC